MTQQTITISLYHIGLKLLDFVLMWAESLTL